MDESMLRHNKKTVYAKYGRDIAILSGDILLSSAFELLSKCYNINIRLVISKAISKMCCGQFTQIIERGNVALTEVQYFQIIKQKTASLFAAACSTGAQAVKSRRFAKMYNYGLNFGIAFQIYDDLLDLIGNKNNLGKPVLKDIELGEMTLPLIILLSKMKYAEKNKFKKELNQQKRQSQDTLYKLLKKSGTISSIKQTIIKNLKKIIIIAETLPQSDYQKRLIILPTLFIKKIEAL